MVPAFFLILGMIFLWLIIQAISTAEIKGRGWGFSSRIYRRDSDPIMYWVTFSGYLVCAIWSTVFGVLMALKALAHPGA